MPARTYSAQIVGLKGHIITVEVDLFGGFHTFSVVGLPDKAVEESRDRISSAIKSTGFKSPKSRGQQKIVVSLSPADLKKEGALFDLPMALGYLLATDDIRFSSEKKLFVGELSLAGELRSLKGALLIAQLAKEKGFAELYLPKQNAEEAAHIDGIKIFGAETLLEVIAHLNTKPIHDENPIPRLSMRPQQKTPFVHTPSKEPISFADIRGQEMAKRGLEIAAAGGHNIAFYGPPGTGKTLLARAFVSILPPLSFGEALEVTGIHSVVGKLEGILATEPPFRSPHHTSSYVSVIGGGTFPKPGEVTLAHRGVLFLDEFPEFDRRVVESLRQPLEEGRVSISRSKGSEIFPAEFMLIAALNPCPCGYRGDKTKECVCSPSLLQKYQRKISGPIIDRIDMWIPVTRIEHEKLSEKSSGGESTEAIKDRVLQARKAQEERYVGNERNIFQNSRMNVRDLEQYVALSDSVKETLNQAAKKLDLSARAYHRIIKLARTIADLERSADIEQKHILEALQYRPKAILS